MKLSLRSYPNRLGLAAGILLFPALSGFGMLQASESAFLDSALGFLGISATPSSLKGEEQERSGTLWVANVAAGARYAMADEGGFGSPVFLHGDKEVLALAGGDIVALPVSGGKETRRMTVPGVVKLVGAHRDDPNQVLLLLRAEAGVNAGILHLDSGRAVAIDHEGDPAGERLLPHLRRSERVYGDKRLLVREERGEVKGQFTEWTDVYLLDEQGGKERNVSRCKPASCSQPSLSFDQRTIVYVKSSK